jgi:hypothetical protein
MRKTILAAVLALALPAWAQAPAPQNGEGLKTVAPKAKSVKTVKWTAKRLQDARHCLQHATNDAIIRCAEEYL